MGTVTNSSNIDFSNIQWYPGHMKKALREINENIKLIDIVVEVLDARMPLASKNPDIDTLAKDKARVIILNKADLADETETAKWEEYFREKGYFCVHIDARNRALVKNVNKAINAAGAKKRERDKKRGILKRPVRALIAGIPNSGKSTFINSYVGKKSAKTGDRPGVTKGKQWIRLSDSVEMLDTPGILWPKFEDQTLGLHLAICGSIKDEILRREELACALLLILKEKANENLTSHYGITWDNDEIVEEILVNIAKKRNYLISGGNPDVARAADAILDDFRAGRICKITLESADEVSVHAVLDE